MDGKVYFFLILFSGFVFNILDNVGKFRFFIYINVGGGIIDNLFIIVEGIVNIRVIMVNVIFLNVFIMLGILYFKYI